MDLLKNVTFTVFELEECSLHKNGVKQNWYHLWYASLAPPGTVRHQLLEKFQMISGH